MNHEKLFAEPSVLNYIRTTFDIPNVVIVSPDAGGAKRFVFLSLFYPTLLGEE